MKRVEVIQAGWVAATTAVKGPTMPLVDQVSPMGSFTEPEYAQSGLAEAKAREMHDIVTSTFLSTGPRGQSSMGEHSAFAN